MNAKAANKKKPAAKKKAEAKKSSSSSGKENVTPEVSSDANMPAKTMGAVLGEIVYVLTTSPGHKHFALADLEWMVMPALLLEQYRIFRAGDRPVGVAFWAYLTPETEEKIKNAGGRLRPDEWAASKDEGKKSEGRTLWLVELIAPFHTPENKLADKMLADLMTGPFKGKKFKFHQTDAKTGERKVMELEGK